MALKKINWVVFGVIIVLLLVWILWSQQTKQTLGAQASAPFISASDTIRFGGLPRGVSQKIEATAFSLPGIQVQVQKIPPVIRSAEAPVPVVQTSPTIQKPVETARASKVVSVQPISRIL